MAKTIWGIHNDTLSDELIDQGFISIGWDNVGDLHNISGGREGIKRALLEREPDAKPRSIAGQAGVLFRFSHELAVGDIVVAPYKPDSTINLGIVSGEYFYQADAPTHRHRRPVQWVKIGLPRTVFTQSALYEFGSSLTLFQITRHTQEVLTVLNSSTDDAEKIAETVDALHSSTTNEDPAEDQSPEQPRASRILRHTRDFILEVLSSRITPQEFEELSAALLRVIGYQARVTQYSQDGGVDIIAHKDPLGVEPPQIKAQCKQRVSTIGAPEVQQLAGTQGDGELCLFFTLGTYSRDALSIERQRPGLRLLSGEDIVTLVMDNYDALPERWRRLIPLTPVLVVADEAE
ncbi:restriction endonuclease [Corynebacterium flavescens]|uniref:restriction endonuclease n=1 Tax=Corynebacterium flavescens TaxID=28028 RepID=UPI003FD0CB69